MASAPPNSALQLDTNASASVPVAPPTPSVDGDKQAAPSPASYYVPPAGSAPEAVAPGPALAPATPSKIPETPASPSSVVLPVPAEAAPVLPATQPVQPSRPNNPESVVQKLQSANAQGGVGKSRLILIGGIVVVLVIAAAGLWWWSNRETEVTPIQLDQTLTQEVEEDETPVILPFQAQMFAEGTSVNAKMTLITTAEEYYRRDTLPESSGLTGQVLYVYDELRNNLGVYAEIEDPNAIFALYGVTGEGDAGALYTHAAYSEPEEDKSYIEAHFTGNESQFDKFIIARHSNREGNEQPTDVVYELMTLKETNE